MKLTEKLLKPITETAYLTAENVRRYRVILRFFYVQYEKIKYWMGQEEVYGEMVSHGEFKEYTMEQCKQDLSSLVEWKNLMAMQDTKKVTSIEAFKNKQFRYQLTEYAVEIERMAEKLEHLFVEGASLEPTLLERIRTEVEKLPLMSDETPLNVYSWWNGLNNDFIRLNQNYQDYMRDLNSAKADELMKTKEFLVFKDKLIEYLRSFVKGLQMNAPVIEKLAENAGEELLAVIFHKVLEYELSIPRIDTEVKSEDIYERIIGRWESFYNWFVGKNGQESESGRLFDLTNESIRKITRYAAGISELSSGGANRKEEYRLLAKVFGNCRDIKEAHKLSSVVFGVEKPFHIKGEFVRETDSIHSGVYEEKPCEIIINPRVRGYAEKANRSSIREHQQEKEEAKKKVLEKIERENELLNSYIKEGSLAFDELPIIEPQVRNMLLHWLSKALESTERKAKTEDGRVYYIANRQETKQCILRCSDGEFKMPAYRIEFGE